MRALVDFLVFTQALGAIGGVVSVIIGELVYAKARQDGRIDKAEKAHLRTISRGLRFGMTLLLLSSLALIIVSYLAHAFVQPGLTASYWILMVLSVVVIAAAWLLSRGRVSFHVGSAIIFTGWWFVLYLALGRLPTFSFGATMVFYVVVTALMYAILYYVRYLLARPLKHS